MCMRPARTAAPRECLMERTVAPDNISRNSANNRPTNTGTTDMNFKLTTLVAAAALAASLCGQAAAAPLTATAGQITYLGDVPIIVNAGAAPFVYSQGSTFDGADPYTLGGAVGTFDVARLNVRGLQGATVDEPVLPDIYNVPEVVRTGITANLTATSHTIDGATGQILAINSSGAIEHSGTRLSGVLSGGVATVSNLRFDLANGLVYADLTGTKSAISWPSPSAGPAVSYDLPDTALWSIGAVSGPTMIDPAALALTGQARIDAFAASGFTYDGIGGFSAQTKVEGLQLTQAGSDFFRNSLGLLSIGRNAFDYVNLDNGWGSATLNLSFAMPAVPEPGSYALVGVGLLVVWGARRARR